MVGTTSVAPQFQLPDGNHVPLPTGWRSETRDGNPIYVDPHGCSYSSEELVPLALAAFEEEKQSGTRGATLRILKHSLEQLREGAHEERMPVSEIASTQKLQDDPEGTDVCGDHPGHMKKILSK